jgi:hypothetical protein
VSATLESVFVKLSLFFIGLSLFALQAFAAACPNLNVHPGVTTVNVQGDYGEKDQSAKAYVASLQDAVKKSANFCNVDDVRTATYAFDVAGIDIDEDHERAALSVVIVSERGVMITHWVRMSSVGNVDKNAADDLHKAERAIERAKRRR